MTKDEALKMAIEAMKELKYSNCTEIAENKYCEAYQACKEALEQPAFDYNTAFSHGYEAHRVEQENDKQESIVSLWDALTDEHPAQEPKCSNHPDAPHGFCRDASHSADRYVCECEGWETEHPAQEPVAWMSKMGSFTAIAETKKQLPKGSEPIALYIHPAPSWVGLSDEEIN